MRIYAFIFVLLFIGLQGLLAQTVGTSVINAGGNTAATPSGGTLEQAVGEVAVQTLQGSNATLTQGVLQPEATIIDAISPLVDVEVKVYPNPVQEAIYIETDAEFLRSVTIWDMVGKAIQTDALEQGPISVTKLASGNYTMGLFDTDGQLRYVWRFQKH
jgi:hypothetical protein